MQAARTRKKEAFRKTAGSPIRHFEEKQPLTDEKLERDFKAYEMYQQNYSSLFHFPDADPEDNSRGSGSG